MMKCIANILTSAEARQVCEKVQSLRFVDGGTTAGTYARTVKRNQQLEQGPESQKLQEFVIQALTKSADFESFAWPRVVKPPMFSRYEPGMEYGSHVDNPVMWGRPTLRTDVSLTLFLSEPETYDGGALIVETTAGAEGIKLPAGSMVVYTSSTLHRVEPVTRGVRVAAVTWVQSLIRDQDCREMLADLENARAGDLRQPGQDPRVRPH